MAQPDRRFAFVLASALGCTVEELGKRMSAAEFAEWQVFFAHEQLHPFIAQMRHAQLLAAIYTGPAKPSDGEKGHRAVNFMAKDPWLPPPPPRPQPTIEELRAQVAAINARMNHHGR